MSDLNNVSADFKEPRDIGYSKINKAYYQDRDSWLGPNSPSIFRNRMQKDLFLFAMALGRYRGEQSDLKDPQKNIPVRSLTDDQKSLILSIGVSDSDDLLCLRDLSELYQNAEKYANEGIKIIQSNMDHWGVMNYAKALESELLEIFEEEIKKTIE